MNACIHGPVKCKLCESVAKHKQALAEGRVDEVRAALTADGFASAEQQDMIMDFIRNVQL